MNYTKYILGSIFIYFITNSLQSQNIELNKDSILVHKVIIKLFDGMREGDSAQVHSVFYDNVRMLTSFRLKTGESKLNEDKLHGFLQVVGNGHQEIWDERISNTIIQIDGDLAQVWTDYSFFVDNKFSHCGVDAFQLVKDNSGQWKIINLIDTRRKTGCEGAH